MKKNCVLFLLMFFCIPFFAESIVITEGVLQLAIHEQSGTFTLYSYSPTTKKTIPLMDTYGYSSSTYFSVLIDKNVYKLIKDAGVTAEASKTDTGAKIVYTVPKRAEVTVDFSFWASSKDSVSDGVKIKVTTQNISSSTQSMAVKMFFDTSLGELSSSHFSTALRPEITSEFDFDVMQYEQWVRSSDGVNSIQFLLYGNEITQPEFVVVGAKDILSTSVWSPVIQKGRSFNSILAYNNSALSVRWKSFQVTPLTKTSVCFYISTGWDGSTPADVAALDKVFPIGEKSSLTENSEVTYTDESGTVFTLGALTDEQLDPAYIQDLLNRIESLQSSSIVDRDEVTRLNAELDAILEKMRKN